MSRGGPVFLDPTEKERAAQRERLAAAELEQQASRDRETRERERETATPGPTRRPVETEQSAEKADVGRRERGIKPPKFFADLGPGMRLTLGILLVAASIALLSHLLLPSGSSLNTPEAKSFQNQLSDASRGVEKMLKKLAGQGRESGWTPDKLSDIQESWKHTISDIRKRMKGKESISNLEDRLQRAIYDVQSQLSPGGISGVAHALVDKAKHGLGLDYEHRGGLADTVRNMFGGVGREERERYDERMRGQRLGWLSGEVRDRDYGLFEAAKDAFGLRGDRSKPGYFERTKEALGFGSHDYEPEEHEHDYGRSGLIGKAKRAVGYGEETAGQLGESFFSRGRDYARAAKHHGRGMQHEDEEEHPESLFHKVKRTFVGDDYDEYEHPARNEGFFHKMKRTVMGDDYE